jgi:hypothetical protein
MTDVTVILNFYNKPVDMLDKQMKALQVQSVVPLYIWGCFLGCKDDSLLNAFLKWKDKFQNLHYITSDFNFKYIGRYQLALTAPTPYIIVLDDDRFPNEDFVKRTREILVKKNCIVGQYGWILDDIKMDINGLFVFPNWITGIKQKGISFKYNKVNLYSNNIKKEWDDMNKAGSVAEGYIEANMIYEDTQDDDLKNDTLLKVDYLCGGMSFRKSALYTLFNSEIITTDTGEDIIFCLKAKKAGIPVYCLAPEYNEYLFADDRNISSTSSLRVLKKRTMVIREVLK